MKKYPIIRFTFAVLMILSSACASAENGNIKADAAIGKPGDPGKVDRTIRITAIEYMFLPSEIDVTQHETIKFVIINKGEKKHEMVMDTRRNLKKHAKMRRLDPETVTHGPNQISVEPGEQKTLIWAFTNPGTIDFACPLPGHFKGMYGKINVETK